MVGILAIHAAATWGMVGLIWFVQLVHYPAFDRIDRSTFAAFQRFHMRRTTWIVAPLMLAEAVAAVLVTATASDSVSTILSWVGLFLLAAIWVSTWRLQVPRHEDLRTGFDVRAHRALVASNWVRTAGWTLRGCVAIGLLTLAA